MSLESIESSYSKTNTDKCIKFIPSLLISKENQSNNKDSHLSITSKKNQTNRVLDLNLGDDICQSELHLFEKKLLKQEFYPIVYNCTNSQEIHITHKPFLLNYFTNTNSTNKNNKAEEKVLKIQNTKTTSTETNFYKNVSKKKKQLNKLAIKFDINTIKAKRQNLKSTTYLKTRNQNSDLNLLKEKSRPTSPLNTNSIIITKRPITPFTSNLNTPKYKNSPKNLINIFKNENILIKDDSIPVEYQFINDNDNLVKPKVAQEYNKLKKTIIYSNKMFLPTVTNNEFSYDKNNIKTLSNYRIGV